MHIRALALRTSDEMALLRQRMELQDSLPPTVRRLVYEFGQTIVFQLLEDGVTDPEDMVDLLA